MSFPDAVATIAPCGATGCPLDRHAHCVRKGCPGAPWKNFGGRSGLYDVDGDGEVVRHEQPMEVSTEDYETAWFPKKWGSRGKAAQWYVAETGCEFVEVRVTTEWLRPIDRYEDGQLVSTWCDGPLWFNCEPTDEGAHPFWRCELR